MIRTNVIFNHPAEFIPVSSDDGVLSEKGAKWFIALLQQVPELEVNPDLCQEDWGVVVFVQRRGKRFWVGLSWYDEQAWVAHFHHHSFAWFQRWSGSGKREFERLVWDAHSVLSNDSLIHSLEWYHEKDLDTRSGNSSALPDDDHA